MNRRKFIHMGIAGLAAGIIVPEFVLANDRLFRAAGGVYYTADAPGPWAEKASSHLPAIELNHLKNGRLEIQVKTDHKMNGYDHYIKRHVLLNRNMQLIAQNDFDPEEDTVPVSSFILTSCVGPICALSICNKHDAWLNVAEL